MFAPAAWLDAPLAARTQGRLRLADASGFWWRGRAVVTTNDGGARMPIAWRVALMPLASGHLVIELRPHDEASGPTGTIDVRRGRFDVRDLTFPSLQRSFRRSSRR